MVTIAKIFLAPTLLPQWVANGLAKVSSPMQRRQPQSAGAQTTANAQTTVDEPCPPVIQIALLHGLPAAAHVQVTGELDRFTYEALIHTAADLYSRGRRNLILDLRQTTRVELSGLFALLSIAHLYSGKSLLDPEGGWAALHNAAEAMTPVMGQRVKLLATPAMMQAVRMTSFCDIFEIYTDPEIASAAFPA